MAVSDEELMKRVCSDSLEAFGILFDRHQPPLYAFLYRIVGDAALAEDLTQDTFWRVWAHRRTFTARLAFNVWLYAIAKNTAFDHFRKRTRETSFDAMREGDLTRVYPLTQSSTGLPLMAERVALRCDLQEALMVLPPEQRMALVLKESEGRAYREIGEILGCSEGNARVLAHRARRAVRDWFRAASGEGEKPCREK